MAVFLYLSGMRIGAFVTMRLKAVNIDKREVKQYPELGVKTKNGKRAKTVLLPIPELLPIVKEWDDFLRTELPSEGFWFAPLRADTGQIDKTALHIGEHRVSTARRNLKAWLNKVDLPYRAPHKFRHGHIQWGRDHSKDIADYKAVSENVMHSNMQITDAIYSSLSGSDLKQRIQNLASDIGDEDSNAKALEILEEAIKSLKNQQK